MERIIFEKQGKAQHVLRCERCDFYIKERGCNLPVGMDCTEGVYVRIENPDPEPEILSLSDATILFKVMHENHGRDLFVGEGVNDLYYGLAAMLNRSVPKYAEADDA